MSFTIAVANSKGGVGKTSISMLLSTNLGRHAKVAVVDSDKQGSASLWPKTGINAHVYAVEDGQGARVLIERLQREYQIVIVDCPPNAEANTTLAALATADLLLIPCRPLPLDMQATAILMTVCRQQYPSLATRVVLNAVPSPMTALARDMIAAIEQQWPTATTRIGQRTAIGEASAVGTLVALKGPGARHAAGELTELTVEVMTTLSTLQLAA